MMYSTRQTALEKDASLLRMPSGASLFIQAVAHVLLTEKRKMTKTALTTGF